MPIFSDQSQLIAAKELFEHIGASVNLRFSIRLWDGSMVALGHDVDPNFFISISSAGVLGALLSIY